jgi:RHS repeat-associated protein
LRRAFDGRVAFVDRFRSVSPQLDLLTAGGDAHEVRGAEDTMLGDRGRKHSRNDSERRGGGGVLWHFRAQSRPLVGVGILCVLMPTLASSSAWAAPDRRDVEYLEGEEATKLHEALQDTARDSVGPRPAAVKQEVSPRTTKIAAARESRDSFVRTSQNEPVDAASSETGKEVGAVDADVPQRAGKVVSPGQAADKTGTSSQAISVPKGSGTVEGMGESFSAQLSTGSAAFSIPIALPAARGGAQPSLALGYSSSNGWGIAGLGWDVGVPYIARQTDRGTPHYGDQSGYFDDQDRFVFNGGQELVPICVVTGSDAARTCAGAPAETMPPWSLGSQYFRARVEGSFLRFFWSADHRTWRVQDKSGVTMELGVPLDASGDTSGIQTNPENQGQISRWSLTRQYDTQGGANPANSTTKPTPVNVVVYRYDAANGPGELLTDIYDTPPAQNPPPASDQVSYLKAFAHHAHLVYEDRSDSVVSYRMGFRVERHLRLAGVDVTSTTFDFGTMRARQLLRRYHLSYSGEFNTSYLTSVQVEGRCSAGENNAPSEYPSGMLPDVTNCARLPAITFEYSHVDPHTAGGAAGGTPIAGFDGFDERVHEVSGAPERSVAAEDADFFDLNSDGLPDFMVTEPGVYGSGFGQFLNSPGGIADSFAPPANLPVRGVNGATAANVRLSNPNVAALDADGDGRVDLLHTPEPKHYAVYSLSSGNWLGRDVVAAQQQDLKIDFGRDALTTRVVDVNGDGFVDVVVTTGTQIQTFLSLGRERGGQDQFGSAVRTGPTTADISTEPIRRCLPWSGTAVSFGDPETQLGDLNGDGLQDIVRLQRGQIRYWPGRGNGVWGTGALGDCEQDTFASNSDVAMANSPMFSDLSGASLRVDDVNGDGLDDVVEVRSDAVDVWLNVNGASWTPRHIIHDTPPSPAFTNHVRLLDINGTGTRDIVWAAAKSFKYLDLDGGRRPGLLTRVTNGLGKTTDITYSTSTSEMLQAEQLGGDCTSGDWTGPWCSKMPIVAHVVKRVTESDNLALGSFGPNVLVTEYDYRDPVYDGLQREFRGFKRARSKKVGDANSPTSFTESQFLLGECVDDTADGVNDCLYDNPREALKGLPVVTETYSESGVYLSTTATAYRLRHLFKGLDGREVRHAFQVGQRKTLYDTYGGVPSGGSTLAFGAVEIETSVDASFDPIASPTSAPTGLTTETITLPVRSATNTAVVEGRSQVDYFGNQLVGLDLGCTSGGACPAATVGIDANEGIYAFTIAGRPTGDETGWLWRTTESYVKGSSRTQVRARTLTTYDTKGNPTAVRTDLQGTVALDRRHRTLTGAGVVAGAPAGASTDTTDATIVVADYSYDSFGNQFKTIGPNGRCRVIAFEETNTTGYAQFPTAETIFTTPNCTGSSLTTRANAFDRGLGKPTVILDASLQATTVAYDELGRLSSITKPNPEASGTPQPSLTLTYTLASLPDKPYSTIETHAQDSASVTGTGYLWTVSFVDGMGRSRLIRNEADKTQGRDVGTAIHDGFVTFDAKGAIARKYLAQFIDAGPTDPPSAPTSCFRRVEYDPFGRVLKEFDCSPAPPDPAGAIQTVRNDYHALSQDIYDAADLGQDANQAHKDTQASQRLDGHGRVVATTERVNGGTLDTREVRTKYLTTGEPEVITRVHVNSPDAPLVRWMRYDTKGRLVLNVDPHTTLNFNEDPTTSAAVLANGLRAWRYAYNDAGDLVGTSDARGCGTNYTYDAAGRVTSEDYSPCEAAHLPYSPADLSTLSGIEVYYQYDSVPSAFSDVVGVPAGSGGSGVPTGYAATSSNLKGKLAAVYDRSGVQVFSYDARGRAVHLDRRLADPDPTVTDVRLKYRGRWYSTDTAYDSADRVVQQSTGAKSLDLLVSGQSNLQVDYSARGAIKRIYGSYGDLVTSTKRSADGLLEEVVYGDAASTTATQTYNSRRWLATSLVSRSQPPLWTSPPANYQPAPTLATPSSFQIILRDESFSYDVVGNPTSITDFRTATDWPAGAKPVSRTIKYDDLYRVTQVDYAYPGGSDTFTSPFAAELAGSTDPRQTNNIPTHLLPTQRVKQQTYSYDWLGSITSADDDAHAMWDRGVGPVSNYASAGMPYRWKQAGDLAVPTWPGSGTAEALAYDEAGNLLDLQTSKVGACSNGAGTCSVRFTYAYDEVGRLNQGVRIEGGVTKADLRFTYDQDDNRIVKGDYSAPQKSYTVYLFATLELRRAAFSTSTGEYTQNSVTETPFLQIGGQTLGRISYEATNDGEPRVAGAQLHTLLNIGDQLGSVAIVVDRATGELAERRTYQAYGATESDYRPARWKAFREDYAFTGKEEDVEVGLQYFGKRYLSPYLGRWVSPDPLAVHAPGQADLNLYAYVSGAVLKAVDPLGLTTEANQAYLDSAAVTHENGFEGQQGNEHYEFQPPDGYEGRLSGWVGDLTDDKLDELRENGFEPLHYIPPAASLPEPVVETPGAAGHELTHDEQVIDKIQEYRNVVDSPPSDEGYGPEYDAWNRAREDYRPVNLGRVPWHGDLSVLRDTEHYLMRYWIAWELDTTRMIPYGLPMAPATSWNPPMPMNVRVMREYHDQGYNQLRPYLEQVFHMSPTTREMVQWEHRGYEEGAAQGKQDFYSGRWFDWHGIPGGALGHF